METPTLNNQMKGWFPHIDSSKKPICYEAFNYPPSEDVCSCCPTFKTLQDGAIHEAMTQTPVRDVIRNFRVITTRIKDRNGNIVAAESYLKT
ncbi:MAG: hypothetical protein L7F78_10595 [Syntrophales bacterium LBB04]|nr:hypothetical protein [Syntrophales bacterium LBB04]